MHISSTLATLQPYRMCVGKAECLKSAAISLDACTIPHHWKLPYMCQATPKCDFAQTTAHVMPVSITSQTASPTMINGRTRQGLGRGP